MTEGFEHLVPLSAKGSLSRSDREQVDKERVSLKEQRLVYQLAKALRISRHAVDEAADRLGGCVDFAWLWNEEHTRVHFAYEEIKHFDILELYTRPTKSPVWESFKACSKRISGETGETEVIMPFTCRNLSQRAFAMHNVERMVRESSVYLTFIVRSTRHFVHPWKEVLDVVGKIWGPEMEAEGF